MLLFQHLNKVLLVTLLQVALSTSVAPPYIKNSRFTRNSSNVFRDLNITGPHPADPDNTMCYGVLGCITINEQRIIRLFPEPLEEIQPKVCLFTKASPRKCQMVNAVSLLATKLAQANMQDTYWITHGYMGSSKNSWIQRLTKTLLKHKMDASVFVIDWSTGASAMYSQASVNLELEAAYIAQLMLRLHKAHGLNVSKIHFIGHSLGAHFGGIVGSWLIGRAGIKLGRISGLDPAQPNFQGYPTHLRLDPTDADFVDVIHTDARAFLRGGFLAGLGTEEPSGHVDFYPNGGSNQPRCKEGSQNDLIPEEDELLTSKAQDVSLGCDHSLAYEYFIESIGSACHFMSFACSSWDDFVNSKCNVRACKEGQYESCNRMGFHARKPLGLHQLQSSNNDRQRSNNSTLYFSITGSGAPYCREQYEIILNLRESLTVQNTFNLKIKVQGQAHNEVATLSFGERYLDRKKSHTFIMGGVPINFKITKATLKPSRKNQAVRQTTRSSQLDFKSISIKHLESGIETHLCSVGNSIIIITDKNTHVEFSVDARAHQNATQSSGFTSSTPVPVDNFGTLLWKIYSSLRGR